MAMACSMLLGNTSGQVNRNHLTSFVTAGNEILTETEEAFLAFRETVVGRGDPAQFDPQVRDCACQTRACLMLRILRNPPSLEAIDDVIGRVQRLRANFRTHEFYHSSMKRKTEKLKDFLNTHELSLFSEGEANRAKIFRFIVVSFILTKYKRSGYHGGVFKDTLESDLPNWKAKLLKQMQEWLSAFSVDFVSDHTDMNSKELVGTRNKLTVLPCFLTANALSNLWNKEPAHNPVVMKLTVRRFCQRACLHSYHDHDSLYAWSAAGVHRLEADEVKDGQQVIQFFSVSVKGDVSVLEKIRTTSPLAPGTEGAPSEEGVTHGRGPASPSQLEAAKGGVPCGYGEQCDDFLDWQARMLHVDFKAVFFTICATHPQYPGTHYSQLAEKWKTLCKAHAPEMYESYLEALARKDSLACHRDNLDLFLYEHITAAVHRTT